MYYIVNASGQTEGPYPADWIRSNAQPGTLVSYQQQWIAYSSHPDFPQAVAMSQPSGGENRESLPVPSRTNEVVNKLASKSNDQLFRESFKLLGIGFACCLFVLLIDQAYLHGLSGERIVGTVRMILIWLVVLCVLLLPAYLLGRLFGGQGRLSEVVYSFSRSIAALYIVLPISLLIYNIWFEGLRNSNFIAALLVIFLFMFVVPLICLVFAFIAIREFVRSMAFKNRWQAWATVASSTVVTTIVCLLLGGWFRWFGELMK